MEWHPVALEYPLLEGDEWEQFKEDIRVHGLRTPGKHAVINGQRVGVDGRNRERACTETGRKYRSEEVSLSGDDEIRAFIASMNDHRRHLTRDQRQRRVATMRAQGQSTRQIAETLGVSQSTVVRDTASGDSFESPETQKQPENQQNGQKFGGKNGHDGGKITGKDGKRHPAKKLCERCERVGEAKGCEACARLRKTGQGRKKKAAEPQQLDSESNEEVITDAEGETVPGQAREAFLQAKVLGRLCRELDDIISQVESICKGPGGRLIRFDSFKQQLKDAKGNLWANRATHVCPYCHGKKKDCQCCKGEGWVARHIWQQAPGAKERAK